MEEKKDTGERNDKKQIVEQEKVHQKQQEEQRSVQDDTNVTTEPKEDSEESKGKIKHNFKNKENQRYVDGLGDGM